MMNCIGIYLLDAILKPHYVFPDALFAYAGRKERSKDKVSELYLGDILDNSFFGSSWPKNYVSLYNQINCIWIYS